MSMLNKDAIERANRQRELEKDKEEEAIKAEVAHIEKWFQENERSEEGKKIYWNDDLKDLRSQLSDFFNSKQEEKEKVRQ